MTSFEIIVDAGNKFFNPPMGDHYLDKIPLPFCGDIKPQNCSAICFHYGLHTQCPRKCHKNTGEYCKTHESIERRPYGDIQDRLETYNEEGRWGLEFQDKKGRKTFPYSRVMEKLFITRELAEKEANKQGVKIPEEHFEQPKKTPKKTQKKTPKKTQKKKQEEETGARYNYQLR